MTKEEFKQELKPEITTQGQIKTIKKAVGGLLEAAGKTLNYMAAWVAESEYKINDLVTYDGDMYICIADVNDSSVTPAADSEHFAPFGEQKHLYRHDIDFIYNDTGDEYHFNLILYTNNSNLLNTYEDIYNACHNFEIIFHYYDGSVFNVIVSYIRKNIGTNKLDLVNDVEDAITLTNENVESIYDRVSKII